MVVGTVVLGILVLGTVVLRASVVAEGAVVEVGASDALGGAVVVEPAVVAPVGEEAATLWPALEPEQPARSAASTAAATIRRRRRRLGGTRTRGAYDPSPSDPPTWGVGHPGPATRDDGNGMAHPLVRSLADSGPMLPTLVDQVTDRAGWSFEPKWDGWRCLAIVDEATVDLRSRRAVDLSPWFPELTRSPTTLADRRAVLDGEIVVLRDGRPDFDAISGRLAAKRLAGWAAHMRPATFVAFDVLEVDGRSVTDEPHAKRRETLIGLGLDEARWTTTMADADGEAMWAATRDLGLEGVVAKDPRSPWVARRSRRWLKCKHWRYGTFSVLGWAASTAKQPGGLVLGAPGAVGEMRVVGVAPLNVDRDTRAIVVGLIAGLRTGQVPLFAPQWRRPVQWISPQLRAEVRYLERTSTGMLRHASVRSVTSARPAG